MSEGSRPLSDGELLDAYTALRAQPGWQIYQETVQLAMMRLKAELLQPSAREGRTASENSLYVAGQLRALNELAFSVDRDIEEFRRRLDGQKK